MIVSVQVARSWTAHGVRVASFTCVVRIIRRDVRLSDVPAGDLDLFILTADGPYNFPTYSMQGTVCKTNLAATTSMRAPGATQAMFMLESLMDQVAKAINMDPVQFRQINFLQLVRSCRCFS